MREMNLVWCIALVAAALAGFAAGIRYAQLRPPPTKIAQQSVESPLTSNKSHHDDLSLYDVTVARRSDSDGAKRWLAVSSPIVPLDNAGFASAATPGKRIAFDVGLGRNSPAAQLWLTGATSPGLVAGIPPRSTTGRRPTCPAADASSSAAPSRDA